MAHKVHKGTQAHRVQEAFKVRKERRVLWVLPGHKDYKGQQDSALVIRSPNPGRRKLKNAWRWQRVMSNVRIIGSPRFCPVFVVWRRIAVSAR